MVTQDVLDQATIYDLACIIDADWLKVNFAAEPYLEAMYRLNTLEDWYFQDSGATVVTYFISNASSWRGETAKAVKAELRKRVKESRS